MIMHCAQYVDRGGGVSAASKPLPTREVAEEYAARRGGRARGWRVIRKEWPGGEEFEG